MTRVASRTSPPSDSRPSGRGHDYTSTSITPSVVEGPRVVCRVRDDGGDASIDLPDEIDAGRCVIQARMGQQLSDDAASVVDAESERTERNA